jgi:hypothetical protein
MCDGILVRKKEKKAKIKNSSTKEGSYIIPFSVLDGKNSSRDLRGMSPLSLPSKSRTVCFFVSKYSGDFICPRRGHERRHAW